MEWDLMITRRELLSMGCTLAAAAVLPRAAQSQSPAPAAPVDPMSLVNPEFRPALEAFMKMAGDWGPLNDATLKQWRSLTFPTPPLAPTPAVKEQMIPGPPGAPQVKVYICGDAPGASKPAILHIHGGGYVMGSAFSSRQQIQDLVIAHDRVAVTVEYRLAPETRFPGSLEDNYAALRWMHSNAKELGIDKTRIAVKGESAGGGHAAALAIAARDRGEFPLCLQVLIYPMLDDRTGSSRQLPAQFGKYGWTPQMNRYGWTALLGVPAGAEIVPQNSVPARLANFAGLAPAFIGVGSIDLFAPEDIDYAQRLIAAGVPTELSLVPGGFHAFDGIAPQASLSIQFKQAWNEAIRRAFATS
jgi:acetyl esterase/lipase